MTVSQPALAGVGRASGRSDEQESCRLRRRSQLGDPRRARWVPTMPAGTAMPRLVPRKNLVRLVSSPPSARGNAEFPNQAAIPMTPGWVSSRFTRPPFSWQRQGSGVGPRKVSGASVRCIHRLNCRITTRVVGGQVPFGHPRLLIASTQLDSGLYDACGGGRRAPWTRFGHYPQYIASRLTATHIKVAVEQVGVDLNVTDGSLWPASGPPSSDNRD